MVEHTLFRATGISKREHSKYGGSKFEIYSNSPGSVAISEGVPDSTSPYAEEGTQAHIASAYRVKNSFWLDDIPDQMVEACSIYVDYIEKQLQEMEPATDRVYIEETFQLLVDPECWGTPDAALVKAAFPLEDTVDIEVIDLKYGEGVLVEIENNGQLKLYGLGVYDEVIRNPFSDLKLGEMKLTICQPRHSDAPPIRSITITEEELLEFEEELREAIEKTKDPDAPRVPGSWCRWCKGAAKCPELRESTAIQAAQVFDVVPTYDPQKLKEAFEQLPQIRNYIKSVERFVHAEAERGRPIPGYKLVGSQGNRRWKDEEKTRAYLINKMNLKVDQVCSPRKLKSVRQVEQSVSKEEFHRISSQGLIERPTSGTLVVPASDPRKAIKKGAEEVFGPVDLTEEDILGD